MTFKWTYVAAILVFAAAFALMVRGGEGGFGGAGYAMGLSLIAVGGLIRYLARQRRPTVETSNEDVSFVSYPEHQVLGILDTRDAAALAIREIRRQGIATELNVYHGASGAASIDSEGVANGVVGVMERTVEHLAADLDDMSAYDGAVRSGKVVVSFDGSDEDIRGRGAEIIKDHGGHTVQHFGTLAIEVLDVDRSRTRMTTDPTEDAGRTER